MTTMFYKTTFLDRTAVGRATGLVLVLATLALASCSKGRQSEAPDHPQLTPAVKMVDVTFHSAALNRDMPYRVVLPANLAAGQKFPVVYLLHGAGGGFHDWSNYSDVARYAEKNLILVMPEGNYSYYTNAAERKQDRYED
jgi:S-formylglutathione hydrolase FrmB